MGWAQGSYLFEDIWGQIRASIREEDRVTVCKVMIEEFNDHDADEWEHHPEWPEYEEAQRQLEALWDWDEGSEGS